MSADVKEIVRIKPLAVDTPGQDVVVTTINRSIHIAANTTTSSSVGWAYTAEQAIELIWGLIHAVEEVRKAA